MSASNVCVQAFRTSTLLRAWQQQQYPDIVAAGVSVLRHRIARLGELLRQGSIVAEVGPTLSAQPDWGPGRAVQQPETQQAKSSQHLAGRHQRMLPLHIACNSRRAW